MTRESVIYRLCNIGIFDTSHYHHMVDCIDQVFSDFENRTCANCKYSSYEIKFGELEFNSCYLVSNGNECKWENRNVK